MPDFVTKVGDTRIDFAFTLSDENGAFDLTGHTVTLNMRNEDTKASVISGGACSVVSAAAGTGTYTWQAADVATAGNYEVEIIATRDSDSAEVRFPRSATNLYYDIQIMPSI